MPSKRPSPKCAAKLRLPSSKAFAALPLAKRTALFARWLKAQPRRKTYNYWSNENCVLAQFAHAIYRSKDARSGSATIHGGEADRYDASHGGVEVFEPYSELSATLHSSRYHADSSKISFGAASDAFHAALKGTS